jgi:hypothetical protein
VGPIVPGERQPPPPELTSEEQRIWVDISASMPWDWFTADVRPLLTELCRHVVYARFLAAEIDAVRQRLGEVERWGGEYDKWRAELSKLMRAHALQSERISQLATKLRMTNQSRYQARGGEQNRRTVSGAVEKPWETWGH